MNSDFAIQIQDIGKCYPIYAKPSDRLKQALWPGKKCFYKEFWALKGVSLNINREETVGIIGSNGSGKSTLLQLICGNVKPTMGELEIHGRVSALLELGAGFNPEFTGRENVYLNAAIMGLTREETEDRFEEIVSFADIGDFLERPVKTYSSGMYVRLAFAVAINVSPDILLIDEALSVGDARFQQKCMAKIRQFCKSGTVIFVSHDTSAITELCTRAIWLDSGKVLMDSTPKKVVEKYLSYMYEGGINTENESTSLNQQKTNDHILDGFVPVKINNQQFGNKNASIESVKFSSGNGDAHVAYSGKKCEISLVLYAHNKVRNPLIGYIVKDSLGREIFGDNTSWIKSGFSEFTSGNRYLVKFMLTSWPNLGEGEYVISLAVADGTFEDHVQCHWAYDVIVVKSLPVRPPVGIFSVPDTKISVDFLPE